MSQSHARRPGAIDIPPGYPCATLFVDESGSKASAGRFFVVAAIKTRKPGLIARRVTHIRDRYQNFDELKFTKISQGRLPIYFDLLDMLADSDVHIAATVVDGNATDSVYVPGQPTWESHARVTAKLLCGSMNKRELSSAIIDEVPTPKDVAYCDVVRRMVNQRHRATALVSATSADSRSMDGLQLADLVAGAIAYGRKRPEEVRAHKSRVARRLGEVFGIADLTQDLHEDRVNILTLSGQGSANR